MLGHITRTSIWVWMRRVVHMRWYITNRFTGDKKYTAGYGGLAL